MAKADVNLMVNGFRGKMGDYIYRRVGSRCIISRAPGKPDKRKETKLQAGTRSRFREASILAKEKMKDPEAKAHYAAIAKRLELPNAYTAALKDILRMRD